MKRSQIRMSKECLKYFLLQYVWSLHDQTEITDEHIKKYIDEYWVEAVETEICAEEAWSECNKKEEEFLASLERGLRDAAEGKVRKLDISTLPEID